MGSAHSSPCDVNSHKVDNLGRPLAEELIHEISTLKNGVQDPSSVPFYVECKGISLVLEIDTLENLVLQRVKRPLLTSQFIEQHRSFIKESLSNDSSFPSDGVRFQRSVSGDNTKQESTLTLEVIAGPSQGLIHSVQSTSTSNLPLMLGRVPPSNLLLKDYEISGKHAMINWNFDKLKWELIDMGSLNGTLVSLKVVNHPDTRNRNWSSPVELKSGDLITLGTTSQIHVQIESHVDRNILFGVGIASDPMAMRRGGKKLPMEDVCFHQWPLPGFDQVGVLGICDGHGGAGAAKSASKLLPEMVANILLDSSKREMVLSKQDASHVLKDAFSQAEANMNHYYEGCTATLLLIWVDNRKKIFLQCANLGDSACIANVEGKQIKMTEDHRVTSFSERQRIKETGRPLKDEDKRLCGLNLGRMLGDKFLKEQDSRFSSKPHISPVVCIEQTNEAFALLASDGFWDVVSVKKAVQLVHEVTPYITVLVKTYNARLCLKPRKNIIKPMQARKRCGGSDGMGRAEKVAKSLVNDARAMRTKDNTSVVYLDFDSTIATCL